ncbi:MAG: [protein-PII] uridylyltransferase [Polyangiaceae bacterium]|nr:[protein-PII] uridylyltransferase [Polyangiaceae bacterium]
MELVDCQNLPFKLESKTLAGEMKDFLRRHEERVVALVDAGGEAAGPEASRLWPQAFDGLICSMFCAARSTLKDDKLWESLSLAAVGSYGRCNLGLKSDLDIRILCPQPEKVAALGEAILHPLWDAGIDIGHQIVSIEDSLQLAKTDIPTATTLLDWRFIGGNAESSRDLKRKAHEVIFSDKKIQSFLDELMLQSEKRWGRFGDSVYLLEPDMKSGHGGTRDLDILRWIAQSRWSVADLAGLVKIGILLKSEYDEIEAAGAFHLRIRNILHRNNRRRTDRLSFDSQEIAARVMGFGEGGPGIEALMSEYYRHARIISNSLEMLLQRARLMSSHRQSVESLGETTQLIGGAVALKKPSELFDNPEFALKVYWDVVHEDAPIEMKTRDAILRALKDADFCERLRQSPQAATYFRRLLREPRKVRVKRNSLLTEFHDVGILLAMIPEFAPVVGRVHHDIYHVYTVDVHSIAAVDKLRAFARGSYADEYALASRLAADIARPQVLYMAALLHDIGKDEGGKNHSDRGYHLCRPILERLGVQEHDIVEIQHLVQKHLRMYHVASRRDLDDEKTINDFRAEVHGTEGLKELYLLTICDVSTTSPTALTTWKARMMEELYVATRVSFDGVQAGESQRTAKMRAAALERCPDPGERKFLEHFLGTLPKRYLNANEAQDIVVHGRMARAAEQTRFSTELIRINAPYAEVGFITDNRSGALTYITAALAANRFRVTGAQLYQWVDSHGRERVLDLFWVRQGLDPEKIAAQLPRLQEDIEALFSGEVTPEQLLARKKTSRLSARPAPDVKVSVNIDNRCASRHTVIEVTAPDRSGLLFRLASALNQAGLSVELAKINTEGNAVADVFYVVDENGQKVQGAEAQTRVESALREAVASAES